MSKINRLFAALALVTALTPLAAFAGTKVDVKVEGMTCGACVEKVTKALNAIENVEQNSVTVNLAKKNAIVTLKNGDQTSIDAIKAAVEKTGYTVAKINVLNQKK